MSLITKHRPRKLKDFVIDLEFKKSLRSVVKRGQHRVILFSGPKGTGKTTLADICRRMVKVDKNDYYIYDVGNIRSLDSIREMKADIQYLPAYGDFKAYTLDECHNYLALQQTGLLNMLEDPPEHCYFFLCTTEPQKLLNTIRAERAMEFATRLYNRKEIKQIVKRVLTLEGKRVSGDVINKICKISLGSARSALLSLERVIDLEEDMALEVLKTVDAEEGDIGDLCRALMGGDSAKKVGKILRRIKEDPETVRFRVLGYFNAVLMNSMINNGKVNGRAMTVIQVFSDSFVDSGRAGLSEACCLLL